MHGQQISHASLKPPLIPTPPHIDSAERGRKGDRYPGAGISRFYTLPESALNLKGGGGGGGKAMYSREQFRVMYCEISCDVGGHVVAQGLHPGGEGTCGSCQGLYVSRYNSDTGGRGD